MARFANPIEPGEISLAEEDWQTARLSVAELRPALAAEIEPFAEHLWTGSLDGPTLHLDDVSAIPFLDDIVGVEQYQHRARLRAGDGDLYAAVTPPTPGYERYARERLGLGSPRCVVADPTAHPLQVAAACLRGEARRAIVRHAAEAGRLLVHPYMGIEAAWHLASEIASEAGVAVEVIGPPPPVTWVANDKARFAAVVERAVGREWLVESASAETPESLAEALLVLASRHRQVALKRLRCASAMGNLVLEAEAVRGWGRERLTGVIAAFLERTEWDGEEAVLAMAWEQAELSPSTQLWIPPPAVGPPRLDGVYEQILEGPAGLFVGSRPARLPRPVLEALAEGALRTAAALQELGYRGRCSFDHLVVGDLVGEPELYFVECNGRWGGTSTPMSLVDRVVAGPRPPYRAQDLVHPGLVGWSFDRLLERVGDQAFDRASQRGRFLFYNVGPMAEFGKLDVVALGADQESAERALVEELPELLFG